MWRGQEYREIFGNFIQMMLIVQNKDMSKAIDIIKNTSNDEDNDNIIYVTEVEELITIKQYEKKLMYSPITLEK
jgi:nitrogen regulatory protein PII